MKGFDMAYAIGAGLEPTLAALKAELQAAEECETVSPPMIQFTVNGIAAPQGSKTRTRFSIMEDNPRTKPWRAEVNDKAVETMAGRPLLHEPVEVRVIFHLPRPQSHYRTGSHAGELKPNAPLVCPKKFDLDKLCRNVGDALTASILRDDVQIVHWDPWKLYGEPARAEITVAAVGSLPSFSPLERKDPS